MRERASRLVHVLCEKEKSEFRRPTLCSRRIAEVGLNRDLSDKAARVLNSSIAGTGGFEGRVEPMGTQLRRLEAEMGFIEKWRKRRRFRGLIVGIKQSIGEPATSARDWGRVEGQCTCHLRVARMGLVADLKKCVANTLGDLIALKTAHLKGLRDRNCILIPRDFQSPLENVRGLGKEPVSVLSSIRLDYELNSIAYYLKVGKILSLFKKVDFLDATEADISQYESKFASMDDFWPQFSIALIRKLSNASLEHELPAIIG